MNFQFERRNSCFLNTTFFLLSGFLTLTTSPLSAAEEADVSPAEAKQQAAVWREEADRLRKAGKTAEAAEAAASAETWASYAKPKPPKPLDPAEAQRQALLERQQQLADQQNKIAEERAKEDRLKNGLASATSSGDYNEAKNYIDQGAKPTSELVQVAVDGGYTGIAYLLMKSGANVEYGLLGKALIKAVNMQDRERVNNLIKLGANVNHAEGDMTPLSAAARSGDLGMIGILLAAGANRDPKELGRVMFMNVEQGDREKVISLVRMGADPNYSKDGTTAFSSAIDRGDYGMASALVAEGAAADPRVLGKALFQSVERGDSEKIAQLIKMGADVNYSAEGITPLTVAIQTENLDVASLLVRSGGTDPSGRYGKKTFEAALAGDTAWLAVLAKVEGYANYHNAQGETPLHAAASTGQTAAVSILLQAGVNPDIRTSKNWTPLHHAARFGHQLALMTLLKADADVYAVNTDGNDAYKLAAIAMKDGKNDIDSTGVINYLKLWMNFHPRPE